MDINTLEIESRNAIAWIWMARPDRHNAFDEVLIEELTDVLKSLDKDSSVRAIVLAGKGKSFSAGADLNWMQRQGAASMEDNLAGALCLAELFRTLSECKKPTVARVHGAAIGGGMGLAAACDMCIASTLAVFATSEVRLGLAPGVISPYVVRAIGERNAYRYFQTAERIDGVRARDIGLVHEVVPPAKLDETVNAILDTLLCGGPHAQAASTDLIRAVANRPVTQELIEDCARRIAHLRASPEAQRGLTAFLEKKTPKWREH